jgi:tetratricopeptide (TPR) repeat protein
MTVEIRYRWLLLLISLVVLVLLRAHPWAMASYVGAISLGVGVYALLMPKRLLSKESEFRREALRLLAQGETKAMASLTERQWFLRRFGRASLVHEILALAAAAEDRHEAACDDYRKALALALPRERPRLQLNLAAEELKAGRLDHAEARYRAALSHRGHLNLARVGLARTLLARGDASEEAVNLFRTTLDSCAPQERAAMEQHLAEAERRLPLMSRETS